MAKEIEKRIEQGMKLVDSLKKADDDAGLKRIENLPDILPVVREAATRARIELANAKEAGGLETLLEIGTSALTAVLKKEALTQFIAICAKNIFIDDLLNLSKYAAVAMELRVEAGSKGVEFAAKDGAIQKLKSVVRDVSFPESVHVAAGKALIAHYEKKDMTKEIVELRMDSTVVTVVKRLAQESAMRSFEPELPKPKRATATVIPKTEQPKRVVVKR